MDTFLFSVLSASLIATTTPDFSYQTQNNHVKIEHNSIGSPYLDCLDINVDWKAKERIFFNQGDDDIGLPGAAKLEPLVKYLRENQELTVELAGFSDPRGTDEYNNVLAHYRAVSVKNHLQLLGIDAKRIRHTSYGANCYQAGIGDLKAYANERRVDIYIYDNASVVLE